MAHPLTLITTAVTTEAGPLIRRLHLRRDRSLLRRRVIYTGTHADRPIVLVVTGMGPEQAAHVVDALHRRCRPDRVLIGGTAGALDPSLTTGQIIVPSCVIDAASGAMLKPTWLAPTERVLRTCDQPVYTPQQKAELFESEHADAVDMETAAIAAICEHYDTPWLCVRAICDTASMTLPSWSVKLVNPRGKPRCLGAACCVLRHVNEIGALMRLGRAAQCAARAWADAVVPLIES